MQVWGKKCSYAHRQVDEEPSRKSKMNGDKIAVAFMKSTRQLGCVFQDMEPPKSSSILRKSSNILKPIRCVRFTKAVLRHANIRDQKTIARNDLPGEPHQRNPNAPKFEDRSQEETERQELNAREAAWKMARCIMKLKEIHKTTFFSPSENWCLPSPSTIKPEKREFVVDSGASMHMISKKDLNSAALETVTTSRSPTKAIIANGEVQTNEEATVYVKELDIFLTMKVLDDIPAVLSLEKLCDEHGYSYEWTNGQKPHHIKNGFRIQCNTENFVPMVVPGLSTSSSSNLLSSTSMTPSRQSSSSSTSPSITSSTVSSESVARQVRGDPYFPETLQELLNKPTKKPKPNKNENHEQVREDPYNFDVPEWLQEFRENLVDDRVPERRDSYASSSHELSLEPAPARREDLGKHSVYTHFPKDRNCEICERTKITRVPRRRRIGGAVLRAENFGDLITADHKTVSEGCES